VKICFKFQSLGKISNISAADPSSFRSIPTLHLSNYFVFSMEGVPLPVPGPTLRHPFARNWRLDRLQKCQFFTMPHDGICAALTELQAVSGVLRSGIVSRRLKVSIWLTLFCACIACVGTREAERRECESESGDWASALDSGAPRRQFHMYSASSCSVGLLAASHVSSSQDFY